MTKKIRLGIDQLKFETLKFALYKNGRNLESEINAFLESLYNDNVSEETREEVAKKSFYGENNRIRTGIAVIALREKKETGFYSVCGNTSFYSLASGCRKLDLNCGKLSLYNMSGYFSRNNVIDDVAFEIYSDTVKNDSRITGVYDFDCTQGIVKAKFNGDEMWRVYEMGDIIEKYNFIASLNDISNYSRENFFLDELEDIEIKPPVFDEEPELIIKM